MTPLTWTPNSLGSQADSPWGMFFINPAPKKGARGETLFTLTLLAPVGARGYRGEAHQTIGTFGSPALARRMAETIAAQQPVY